MPWAPGIDFEQGKLFAQGLGAFGQEIGAGVQEALKRYHETQQQKSYAEGTFQAFSRNPDLRKYLIGDLKKGEDPQTALIRAQTEFEHAGTTKKMGIIQGAQVAATADIEEAKRRATLAEAGMYGAHQAYYAQLASQAKLAAENVEEFDPAKPGTFLLDSEGRVSAIRQRNVKTGAVTWKVPQYPIDVSGTPGFKPPAAAPTDEPKPPPSQISRDISALGEWFLRTPNTVKIYNPRNPAETHIVNREDVKNWKGYVVEGEAAPRSTSNVRVPVPSGSRTAPPVRTTLKPGDVVKGMRYKGGNPNDPNNWERVATTGAPSG